MAKDPAFLFYPNDWIGGTMGMTFEEKGAYMELLMLQFNRGHMTEDMIRHTLGHMFGQVWVKIEVKFSKDNNGLWYNPRLDEEKIKRQKFTESRRNNVLGQNQHTKKEENKRGHMTYHMENENENVNKGIKKGGMGENIKGVKFDENFEFVYFSDGTKQSLGADQKALAEDNRIKPNLIIKGSIY